MKKWLVVAMAFWLTSCSSSGDNKSYYQLPVAQGGVQSSVSQGNRLLWVEQVSVPDYLAGNGVVYQTSDVQYVIANNNLWASPLDQQLRNTPVTGFHGRYDGKVVVSGEWLLNHQGRLIKRPFHIEAVQTQDGYDEMVKVLATVWSQEAAAIAQELKRIP